MAEPSLTKEQLDKIKAHAAKNPSALAAIPFEETPEGERSPRYFAARRELGECARLLKDLGAVDGSRDLTGPAWKRAREALALASKEYAAAHDAHFGGGSPEERRKAARAVAPPVSQ